MADQFLYHAVRHHLEEGCTLAQTQKIMMDQGYPITDISNAVAELFEIEQDNYDDAIAKKIGKEIHSKPMQHIFAELINDGYMPFEIEKSLMHVGYGKTKITSILKSWHWYSVIQVGILVATILLGVVYDAFVIAASAIFLEMVFASLIMPRSNKEWRKEVTLLPVDVWISDNILGYNQLLGNYWRHDIFDPATVVCLIFLVLSMIYYPVYGSGFIISCMVLSAISFLSYWVQLPHNTVAA
jgi:hypothetical protein